MNRSYYIQSVIITTVFVYLLIFISTIDPKKEIITCDSNYVCTLEDTVAFNYKTRTNFNIRNNSNLNFKKVRNKKNMYRIEIGNQEYFKNYFIANDVEIEKIKEQFSNYTKNPSLEFFIKTTEYKHACLIIGFTILPVIILLFLYTDEPLVVILKFIGIFFNIR